ncbi:hypothetical protein [Micromonospora sp. NPDC005413]
MPAGAPHEGITRIAKDPVRLRRATVVLMSARGQSDAFELSRL